MPALTSTYLTGDQMFSVPHELGLLQQTKSNYLPDSKQQHMDVLQRSGLLCPFEHLIWVLNPIPMCVFVFVWQWWWGAVIPQSSKQFSRHQLGVLQFNSILTLSTQR